MLSAAIPVDSPASACWSFARCAMAVALPVASWLSAAASFFLPVAIVARPARTLDRAARAVERLSLRSATFASSAAMVARAAAASACAFFTPSRRSASSKRAMIWPRFTVSPVRTRTDASRPAIREPALADEAGVTAVAAEDPPRDAFGLVLSVSTAEARPGAVGSRLAEIPTVRSGVGGVIAGAATEMMSSRTVPATVNVTGREAAEA